MDADEIILLTTKTIDSMVSAHRTSDGPPDQPGKRGSTRWPFPGTTQLWLAEEGGAERLVIGTCCNLSGGGLGIRTDEPLPVGVTAPIAIHLPQATYQGKAIVRHCTEKGKGYYAGLEFQLD